MNLSGEYQFDAPQEMVWESLLDPQVLGTIMPGGQGIEQVGDNAFKGMLHIKVGPVQGTFQGDIKLSNVTPPESYQIDIDGKGAPGFVKAKGQLQLEGRGSQTHMTYSGTAQVGGRIASVGQRLMDSSARSIVRQSLDALNEYLKVKVAQQSSTDAVEAVEAVTDAVEHHEAEAHTHDAHAHSTASHAAPVAAVYRPPSQMDLALNVMKDVLGDMIPPVYRPVVAGLVLVLIVILLWYFAAQ